ncbi:MAG: CpaF family protein, partial [Azospirillaceae bacterium]
ASPRLTAFREGLWPAVTAKLTPGDAQRLPRKEVARRISDLVMTILDQHPEPPDLFEQRHLVTVLINDLLSADAAAFDASAAAAAATQAPAPEAAPTTILKPRAASAGDRSEAADAPAAESAEASDGDAAVPGDDPAAADETAAGAEAPSKASKSDPAAKAEKAAKADTPATGEVVTRSGADADKLLSVEPAPVRASGLTPRDQTIEEAKRRIRPHVLDRIDVTAASKLDQDQLERELSGVVAEIRGELQIQLNKGEHDKLVAQLVDDMVGLGPLEPLLEDEKVTDIMVNGANQVYVERGGKLELTDVRFQNDAHVMNIATRIVSRIGRRVDESSPICDARLADGSRVNVIIPPLAIVGPSISIRKFSRQRITLDTMSAQSNLSAPMAKLLKIGSRSRLNILISGGTGSGKTTLLNALSQLIDHGERIVTIEDAAELQLQQPHVVRLETRPANLEGQGEIAMRDLVKNALRMRPDRIILGEVRGPEAVDMLQAMNTGHEGSMCTLHANRPRDALTRLENMIGMAGINLPAKAVRTQIASALDLIVQVSRMRDGKRRITHVVEVVGMEGDVITTQELYNFNFRGEDASGRLIGEFASSGLRPHFTPKAEYFGLGQALMEVM